MGIHDHHADARVRTGYATYSLTKSFPELIDVLSPTSVVLDMGCGPGSITLDVAKIVSEGRVTGIDLSRASIEDAITHAAEAGAENVTFSVGNATSLPCNDATFDVVYSHAVLEWIPEPVDALREQYRVLRPKGVAANPLSDLRAHIMYPACPALEKVFDAWSHWSNPNEGAFVQHRGLARRIVDLLRRVGFEKIETRARVDSYRNLAGLNNTLLDTAGTLGFAYRDLFAKSILAQHMIDRAKEELSRWHQEPEWYMYGITVVAIARK